MEVSSRTAAAAAAAVAEAAVPSRESTNSAPNGTPGATEGNKPLAERSATPAAADLSGGSSNPWPAADYLAAGATVGRTWAEGGAAATSSILSTAAVGTPGDPAQVPTSKLKPDELPQRVASVQVLHDDFSAALAQAAASASHEGAGWVRAWEPTPGDANGAGHWAVRFSAEAFRDAYLAAGGAALQAVARLYGAGSIDDLLAARPELRWTALDLTSAASPALNGEAAPPTWNSQTFAATQPVGADGQTPAWITQADEAARAHWQQAVDAAPPGTYAQAPAEELRAIDQMLSSGSARVILSSFEGPQRAVSDLDPAKVGRYGVNRARAMDMMERANRAIAAQGGIEEAVTVFMGDPLVSDAQLAQADALMAEVSKGYLEQLHTLGISDTAAIDGYLHSGALGAGLTLLGVERRFAQTDAKLSELAKLWGYADGSALLAAKPEILRWIADPKHERRDGPAIGNVAMAPPAAIGQIDLSLSDPLNQSLIAQFGGPPPTPTGALANELVRQFGLKRYQAMTQLSVAVNAVRQDYLVQLNNARTDAMNPAVAPSLPFLKDGKFSVEAFTAWYEAQPGAANQAFAQLMGPLTVRTLPADEGVTTLHEFGGGTWQLTGGFTTYSKDHLRQDIPFGMIVPTARDANDWGNPAVYALDPQNPPELNTLQAVMFDPRLGWITPPKNFHHEESLGSQVLKTVVIVGITVGFAYGASIVGAAALGAGGGTAAGASAAMASGTLTVSQAVAAGAAAGAASAAVGAALDSNTPFRWKDVLKGAFTGGLGAGIAAELGEIKKVADFAKQNAAVYQAMLNGGTQALLGESFKNGLFNGFVGGMASQVDAQLVASINKSSTLSAAEKAAALTFAHALSSAMRIAADPSNPSSAFASAFIDSVLRDPDLRALAAQAQGSEPAPTVAPAPPAEGAPAAPTPVAASDDPKDPAYWSRMLGDDPRVADLPPDPLLAGGDAALALDQLFNLAAENLEAFKQALNGRAITGRLAAGLLRLGVGASLLVMPGNVGQGSAMVMLDGSDRRRLVLDPGALYGRVEYLTAAGDWLAEAGPERRAVRVGDQWRAMSDAEIAVAFPQPSQPAPAPSPAPAPVAATPAPAPVPATPEPTPAPAPTGASSGSGAAPRPPGAPSPAPATPTPAPVAAPATPSQPGVGYVPEPVDTTLPGYGDDPAPLPDMTLPAYPLLPPGSITPPLTGSPIVTPPPSGPPPSGSTTPVDTPTLIWTPPADMSMADYLILAERNNWPIPQDVHASLTRPQGVEGGQPVGRPAEPSDAGKRAENRTAHILAGAGYRVRQGPAENPEQRAASGLSEDMQRQLGLDPDARPDFLIEGRVFDCYAPTSSDAKSVVDHMLTKVNEKQSHRLVVNLDEGTSLSIRDVKAELSARADRSNIHEIIFIERGRIVHVLPNQL